MSIESGRAGTNTPKGDEWRDGMVEQVSEYMDKIKDLDAKEAVGADTVLEEAFETIGDNATDAVMDMLAVYTHSDTSGRSAIAEVFHALTGETFDYFLMQASDACQQTLCLVEDESLDDLTEKKVPDRGRRLSDKQVKAEMACDRLDAEREPKVDVPIHDEESLDEMMEQVAEVAGDSEIGDEMSVSNGER